MNELAALQRSEERPDPLVPAGPEASAGSLVPPSFHLEPWPDPVIDAIGYDARSSYVETFWLPVLGPSTIWLLRRFASHLEVSPEGTDIDSAELARRLGVGERSGPSSPFCRTLRRCVDFQMARWQDQTLAVRRHLPPLAQRHLRRLPESLRAEHEAIAGAARHPLDDRLKQHGRRLALSVLDYGEDQATAESQLVRWGFERAVARECAVFAALVQARRKLAARPG